MLRVDDQAYFRRVLGVAGEEVITAAADSRADPVSTDVPMPGIDRAPTTAMLLEGNRDRFIVPTSADPIEPSCALAARTGEVGFVPTGEFGPHRLLDP